MLRILWMQLIVISEIKRSYKIHRQKILNIHNKSNNSKLFRKGLTSSNSRHSRFSGLTKFPKLKSFYSSKFLNRTESEENYNSYLEKISLLNKMIEISKRKSVQIKRNIH